MKLLKEKKIMLNCLLQRNKEMFQDHDHTSTFEEKESERDNETEDNEENMFGQVPRADLRREIEAMIRKVLLESEIVNGF